MEAAKTFARDRLAWFCYLMIATHAFVVSSLGPLMTFLRAELYLDYTTGSFHFSAVSLGAVIAGGTGEKVMSRLGKAKTIYFACAGACAGILTLMCAGSASLTIGAAFLIGLFGSLMCQTLATILSERFQELRSVAISEACIAASVLCSLSPLAVSVFSKSPPGWRQALLLPVALYGIFLLMAKKDLAQIGSFEDRDDSYNPSGRLPRAYWICWILIFMSVASEWSVIYWGADFMEKSSHLSRADSAASITVFLIAMLSGRIAGSRLAREIKSLHLLKAASIVSICGFMIFWLNSSPPLCIAGLFITGLGIANLYPLTLSLAVSSAPGLAAAATSRMSLASGGSTLTAPLIMGFLAEKSGISFAFSMVATLLCLCCILTFLPLWSDSKNKLKGRET